MQNQWDNLAIALAGIFQAAALVETLAKTGYVANGHIETAVNSLINQNPASCEDVFGGIGNLQTGLNVAGELLQNRRSKNHPDTLRYVLGILYLQKKLKSRPNLLNVIDSRIGRVKDQLLHFPPSHENVVSNVAELYSETISTFSYRIQVMGDYNYLQQPRVASQIRTLLFSGIRAAILWQQLGGSRLKLLIHRKRLLQHLNELHKQAKLV